MIQLGKTLELITDDFVLIKGAISAESVNARSCPNITSKIGNNIFKWHVLIAATDAKIILGVNVLLKFKMDVFLPHGVIFMVRFPFAMIAVSLMFSVDISAGETFKMNMVVVGDSIMLKLWSGKYMKMPANSK